MAKRSDAVGIEALARTKWESSGIDAKSAQKLKLKALLGSEVQALSNTFHPVGALKIPYFSAEGEEASFYRLRYLEELPGFAGVVKKPQRYVQPPGTLCAVYLPPLMDHPWSKVMDDPSVSLIITEGELKAACATSRGYLTMGLGGVDSWRAKKKGIDFLPVLGKTSWQGREVFIAYDSDAATNENVVRAQLQLAAELTERGAVVRIISLPPGPKGEKQGLDDYLVKHTDDEFEEVLEAAETYAVGQALWEMNQQVVYIRDPGLVLVRGTGQKMSSSAFTQHAYADHHHKEQGPKGLRKVSTAKQWIEWPARAAHQRLTYSPGEPLVTRANEYNTWRGWGCEPKKGDVTYWQWLLRYLFEGEDDARVWFERWLAYPLQHPGTKLYTAAVLWGRHHGTGKTLVGYHMQRIYGDNALEIKEKHLHGNFNSWAQDKQFIIGDEVTGTEKRSEANALKGLITQEEMLVNAKYVPEFRVKDCCNYYFTSNQPDAFFLEDTDRRFFVHEVAHAPKERKFYEAYDKWYRSPEGPSALFYHLLHLDLGDFNPRGHALETAAKREMIDTSKTDLGLWVAELRATPQRALKNLGERAAKEAQLLTVTQIRNAFDPTGKMPLNTVARELRRAGFIAANKGAVVWVGGTSQKLYIIRNAESWVGAKTKIMARHWEDIFGKEAY